MSRWPFGGYGGEEAEAESDTVEEHVDGVGEEAEGVGSEAVEGLDDHECEIKAINWLAHIAEGRLQGYKDRLT